MKTFLVLLLICFLIILTLGFLFFYRIGEPIDPTRSKSYYRHAWKDKFVHSMMGNWFELSYSEFEADKKTFQVLSEDFAKDNTTVFWCGQPQLADAQTFEIDSFRTPKDRQRVYLAPDYGDKIFVVEGAHPDSYEPIRINNKLSGDWYKDDRAFYLTGKQVLTDYHSFEIVNETISADKNYVYVIKPESITGLSRNKVLVQQAKRPSGECKALNANYAKIGNAIILSNWKTDFAMLSFETIDSVSVIDERRIIVNGQLLSDGVLLPDFDVNSFVNLDRDHIRDSKYVYYNSKKIEGADAATFEVPYEDYSKDKNHVYFKGMVLAGVNPSSFTYQYNTGIATDGQHQYKDGVKIK